MTPATADAPPRPSLVMTLILLVVGTIGIAAAWVLLAYARDAQSSWMAVVAAIDAAFLLRLARAPSGWWRAATGVGATLAVVALANWGIAATQIGKTMGMLPWESLTRLGPVHAWTLIGLANTSAQIAWILLALATAAVASR